MGEITFKNMPNIPFEVEEAVNQLRVNLSLCGDKIRCIAITSSTPNEGKSFVSMQLWRMMANVGNRVLFIDGDLRNSEIRTRYNLSCNEEIGGIVHYLAGRSTLEEAIYSTNITNGYIMPLKSTVVNPSILLESENFKVLLQRVREDFDYVIIDTPPLANVADALNIAVHADGTVLVVRSGKTPRHLVENSIQLLERTETPMLGVVLSRAELSKQGKYSRYYRYGYGYGYGYGQYGSKNDSLKRK